MLVKYLIVPTGTERVEMLVELITPLIIATSPMSLTMDEPNKYSHEQQKIVARNGNDQTLSLTLSGTRTYDGGGRPFDSDAD